MKKVGTAMAILGLVLFMPATSSAAPGASQTMARGYLAGIGEWLIGTVASATALYGELVGGAASTDNGSVAPVNTEAGTPRLIPVIVNEP